MRRRSAQRVVRDLLLSLCSIAVLLAALVLMDERVREQLTMRSDAQRASAEIASTGARVRKLGRTVVQVVKDQSDQNRPLMYMLLAGAVLTVVMFRT